MSTDTKALFHEKMGEVLDLQAAGALLSWDQEVYMPPKGAEARGKQLATLAALAHRLFVSDDMGALLGALESEDANDALLRETRHDFDQARKLPESFVARFAEAQSRAYHIWVKARETSDFPLFQPALETMVALNREKADLLGYAASPYDALLDEYERGMTAGVLSPLFGDLAAKLSVLVAALGDKASPEIPWLDREWDVEAQWRLTLRVVADLGFDLEAGRQDRSVHPFTTNFDTGDVRITTRLNPRDPFSALMGSIHECGHALYEQGFLESDRRTLLAQAPSLGIHESQSRLWENVIGRSEAFWDYCAPLFKRHFDGMDAIAPEAFYRAVNRVAPSLIRVEADECTYNLHIVLRFELERALIEGTLAVSDIPEAWNEKMRAYLGVDVPDDAQGCLQDIHWSHGSFGYFPTYALGNLYAAQLAEAAQRALPGLWDDIRAGRFGALLGWLRENVHRHGRRFQAAEIVEKATGAAPDAAPFIRYLETKYERLYALRRR